MSDPPANVSRAVQYREIAENCGKWAKEARIEAERKDFLDMARTSAPMPPRNSTKVSPKVA